MPLFDDATQNRRVTDIRKQEEEDLVQLLASEKYDLPYINLRGVLIDNEALRAVPQGKAEELEVAPFKKTGKRLFIAVRAPHREDVQNLLTKLDNEGYEVKVYMASRQSLAKVWRRYEEISYSERSSRGSIDVDPNTLKQIGEHINTIPDVKALIDDASRQGKTQQVSQFLDIIMAGAITLDASDVHIEPQEDAIRIRYRIDGVLQPVLEVEYDIYKLVTARIKLLSGMKLTITDAAQDGRFSIYLDDDEVNIRTSTVPGPNGEGIVMRILNPKTTKVHLEELGFPKNLLDIVVKEIKKPNGLILLTGPTGSGKTTSLYSFLRTIYTPEIKVITIENPIEYKLEGITQTQTDNDKNYTFATGLRAAMRQDPDVVMVGEIRDAETASIAVQASLTGHLVFSTLHTNNAQGVIPRLIDLGVNPKIIGSALSLSIAQRLVRRLCPDSKQEVQPTDEQKRIITDVLKQGKAEGKDFTQFGIDPDATDFSLWEPGETKECPTGYSGRIGIFEAIQTDAEIERVITQNPSEREIKKVAEKQGLLDMKEDGVVKMLQGVTSFAEVQSVVDLEEN